MIGCSQKISFANPCRTKSQVPYRFRSFELLEKRIYLSASTYTFETVAVSGVAISSFGLGPSINDAGAVAFAEYLSTGGKGIFVAPLGALPRNITPSYEAETRSGVTFREQVQINNSGLVVNTQAVIGSRNVIAWDSNSTDSSHLIAHAFVDPARPLQTALAFDSISNNGSVVFVGRPGPTIGGPVIVYQGNVNGPEDFYTQIAFPNQSPTPLQLMPMIADDGAVVLRYGANPTDPIVLVSPTSGNIG